MSTDVYAGQLCATHLNERISHPDLDTDLCWWLIEIRFSHRYPTTMVIAKGVDMAARADWAKEIKTLRLACDDVVTIARR